MLTKLKETLMITGLFYNKGYDPLEEGMATQSSILAGGIPWAEEPGYNSRGLKEWDTAEWVVIIKLWWKLHMNSQIKGYIG